MNIFEQASRTKLRFNTPRGQLATENLWDIPLDSINGFNLYAIDSALVKSSEEVSASRFSKDTVSVENQLRLDIIKHIVESKLAANTLKAEAKVKATRKAAIMEILAKKSNEKLENASEAELLKELESL